MAIQLTEEDGKRALKDHVIDKASAARAAHPNVATGAGFDAFLSDSACVRYRVAVQFDARPLGEGEFACLEPIGERPSEGFVLFVHPSLQWDERRVAMAGAYYIPSVNYGEIATHTEAELYGSTLMGMDQESYYEALCALADGI